MPASRWPGDRAEVRVACRRLKRRVELDDPPFWTTCALALAVDRDVVRRSPDLLGISIVIVPGLAGRLVRHVGELAVRVGGDRQLAVLRDRRLAGAGGLRRRWPAGRCPCRACATTWRRRRRRRRRRSPRHELGRHRCRRLSGSRRILDLLVDDAADARCARSRPASDCWNASSRFGPDGALGAGAASTWQEPHFATNSFLPATRSALALLVLAAAPSSSASAAATSGSSARRARQDRGVGAHAARELYPLAAARQRHAGRGHGLRRQLVEPALGGRDHAARHALPRPALAGGRDQRRRASRVAHVLRRLQPRRRAASARSRDRAVADREATATARGLAAPRRPARADLGQPGVRGATGSAPHAAASAATIPNASGNVLGTTCASHGGSSGASSSCSRRPVEHDAVARAPRPPRR